MIYEYRGKLAPLPEQRTAESSEVIEVKNKRQFNYERNYKLMAGLALSRGDVVGAHEYEQMAEQAAITRD